MILTCGGTCGVLFPKNRTALKPTTKHGRRGKRPGCLVTLLSPAAIFLGIIPTHTSKSNHGSPQLRLLGLEPRTHGLKVCRAFYSERQQTAICLVFPCRSRARCRSLSVIFAGVMSVGMSVARRHV